MSDNPQIHATGLPDSSILEMDFLESSFFKDNEPHRCLPTPAEVRGLWDHKRPNQPLPVRFEDLNLIVKFGPHVEVAEAQSLWALKRVLGDKVPVPEVYGWRVDGRDVFIYMELIRGETLIDQWDSLSIDDRTNICDQLRQMITSLRQVEQDPNDTFVGSINRHRLLDYVLEGKPPGGPFATVKEFNDWFALLPFLPFPDWDNSQNPWRTSLPDTGPIKLTHGDLHRGNIIISTTRPPRVLAIIDWAHCGWYPDYWEYCKAAYTCSYDGEWRNKWIPMFLTPQIEVHDAWANYINAMGAI